ncbi:solute carrier family 25 member 40-like [Patiria miniata]|uniref:Solute carrier family 25 member 40 n=1 Tax=Patiria miniata TaxID=46514 RepID=A0A914BPL2_PATMI|nr:solute carrier family 25 member 40-like [Patiria miniata]
MPRENDGHSEPRGSVAAARCDDDVSGRPAVAAGPPQHLPPLTPVQQMVSSGTGAFLTALFMTPLDVVKIRLQTQMKPMASGQCFLYCNGLMDHICTCINGKEPVITTIAPWYKRPGQFNGTVDAMFKIAKNEGISKLWSGLPPTLLMAVPATVLYYTCYDQLKEWMGYQNGKSSMLIPMASGGLARVFAVTVISPLELVRTKMQSRPLTYNELVSCIRTAIQDEGWLSLWRGLGPTLLRDVPFSMILWVSYEYMKARVCLKYHRKEPTFLASFLAGAVSGTVAAVLTSPFDVVKTHRQIELGEAMFNTKKDSSYRASSTWHIMQRLYAERGFRGLFAGISPRIAKVTPACAMMISTYEAGKAFFHKRNEGALSLT